VAKARWAIIILLATNLGVAAFPRPSNKPLTHDDILYLLNNYVPSQSVTNLVKENGVNFDPQEDYLKKVQAAGGKEDLLKVLRGVHGSGSRPAAVQRPAADLQIEQHLSRALELEKLESYPQAEQEYRAALAIQSQNSTLHVGLGRALCKQQKWDEALAEYREAIRLNPQSAEAHGALGLAISLRGDPAAAIPELREALRLNPHDLQARNILGASLYNVHDVAGALKELHQTAEMAPDTAAGHYASAQILLLEKRDAEGAIAEFRQALSLDPYTWFPHGDYANALAAKGDWDGAIFEYRQALRLQPDSVVAHSNLGFALANKGDLAGGTAEVQYAMHINPNTPQPHLVNGLILAVQQKLPAAMDEYR
jgi:tetratricopeptide (TPR) repeat protein